MSIPTVLRPHAEQEYAEELAELERQDDRVRPTERLLGSEHRVARAERIPLLDEDRLGTTSPRRHGLADLVGASRSFVSTLISGQLSSCFFKNNCRASFHLHAELIRLSEAAAATPVEAAACEQTAWDGV